MKKTITLTDESNQLLKQLAANNDTTESKIVKWAIEEYADRDNRTNDTNKIIDLKSRIIKIQEQNFHLLNLLNSLIEKMDFDDGYFSAEELPCHWYDESKKEYHQKQLRNRLESLNNK